MRNQSLIVDLRPGADCGRASPVAAHGPLSFHPRSPCPFSSSCLPPFVLDFVFLTSPASLRVIPRLAGSAPVRASLQSFRFWFNPSKLVLDEGKSTSKPPLTSLRGFSLLAFYYVVALLLLANTAVFASVSFFCVSAGPTQEHRDVQDVRAQVHHHGPVHVPDCAYPQHQQVHS